MEVINQKLRLIARNKLNYLTNTDLVSCLIELNRELKRKKINKKSQFRRNFSFKF